MENSTDGLHLIGDNSAHHEEEVNGNDSNNSTG